MVDVRRLFASLFAVAALGLTTLPGLASGSKQKAHNFGSTTVWTETANHTLETARSRVTSESELPKKWLILGMGLAAIVAVAMLFILFKPDKSSEPSERHDSESSET